MWYGVWARPGQNRPTITDVAKLCGVTPATVSRVLNGKKKFSASEAVREKIFNTARKLGYVPDLAARNLNRRNTRIIGLFASPRTHVAEGINESLLDTANAFWQTFVVKDDFLYLYHYLPWHEDTIVGTIRRYSPLSGALPDRRAAAPSPCRITANAEGTSLAAPQARPECAPIAA